MLAQLEQPFEKIVETLANGGLVVYPTETYYGLGSVLTEEAVGRLVGVKGRAPDKPLPILVGSEEMIASVASELPPMAMILARHFWPGPLTLVLPAREGLPLPVKSGPGTVGVRVSAHPIAAGLSLALGQALVATSANPAGMLPPVELATAESYFGSKVDAYLDAGHLAGVGSTVVRVEGQRVEVVRPGAISHQALQKVLPDNCF